MKKLIIICLICVCLLSAVSTVLADDLYPPSWRGLPNSMTAEWDSWIGFTSGSMFPTWTNNPPISMIPPVAGTEDGASRLEEYQGRDDVIQLSGDDQIDFWMPNYEDANPYKDIQIQITYYPVDGTQYSWIEVGASYPHDVSNPILIHSDYIGEGWWIDVWTARIEPNPSYETIHINFFNMYGGGAPLYPAYIDQVVIDTICPEPTTIAMLGIGALSLIRRKK